jgi:hypothetical protein
MCVKPSPTAASATASHSLRSTSLIDFSTCAQERVISRYPVDRAGRCSGAVVDSSHRFSTETREGGGVLRSKRHTLILAEPRSSPPSIPRLRAPTASRSPCRHERRHATPPSLLRKKMAPLHDLHACSEGCAWPGLQRGESVKAPPAATVQNATENHSTRRAGKVPITPQNLHRTQSTEDNPNERVCWRAPPPRLLARSEGRKGLGDPEVEELQVLAYEVSGNCGAVSSEGEGGPTTQLVVKREGGFLRVSRSCRNVVVVVACLAPSGARALVQGGQDRHSRYSSAQSWPKHSWTRRTARVHPAAELGAEYHTHSCVALVTNPKICREIAEGLESECPRPRAGLDNAGKSTLLHKLCDNEVRNNVAACVRTRYSQSLT